MRWQLAKWMLVAAALPAVAAISLLAAYQQDWLRLNNPSRAEFPVWGLDVSHHQGPIDWPQVSRQNFQFVFMKATEGGDFRDPRFAANWRAVQQTSMIPGAYHYFTFCRPVVEQVKNLLAIVPPQQGTLPPMINLEFGGNCKRRPSIEVLQGDVLFFMQEVQSAYGKPPILYVTRQFYQAYAIADLPGAKIWMRNVWHRPGGQIDWLFWQFSSRGRVPGISTPVDLNVFRGSEEAFLSLVQ